MMQAIDKPTPLRSRITVRLIAGVILALLAIGVPFLLAFQRLQRQQQLDTLEEATTGLSRVIVDGLSSAMVGGKPHLLDDALRNLAAEPEVVRVILINHEGRVRVSSDPVFAGRTLIREEEQTCRVCHRLSDRLPESRSAVVEAEGQRVFRTMNVIRNEPSCHQCHDPAVRTNGILLMDLDLSAPDRRSLSNISGTALLGIVMALLTVAVLSLLLRRMVLTPLHAIVGASRRIAAGDLEARAEVDQPGEFAFLASQVNRMTDHLAKTLNTVDAQRRELQSIVDAVDDEIVVLDHEERIVAANEAYRAQVAPSGDDVIGRRCEEVSVPPRPCTAGEPDGCPVREVFRTGMLRKAIVSSTATDGSERTTEIHASPLLSAEGEVKHVVEVRRDISERRQMEANLEHSERLASLGLLASGISHEINNPLAAIATCVDGLRRRIESDPPPTAAMSESLLRIAGEVQRGRSITDRLLKVARPPSNTRSLVDVNRSIRDIVAILAESMRASAVELRLELAEDLPPLPMDESQMGQIVMNLTLNAVQAMGEKGGDLMIRTFLSPEEQIGIEVSDTGCGIPSELRRRIFEPFFTTKPAGRGTGLGLFIVQRIVTQMDGSLQIKSNPGEGTTFTVRLPRSRRRQ